MAKERDGSINIYGSLQAKTEDGIVVYTDGIAHENEDGTKTPLDQLLKDSGGIIDVDKLPQQGWSGTAVPCDGTFILDDSGNITGVEGGTVVKNLYLNTNLSIKETIEEMEKVTNWFVEDEENYTLFFSNVNCLFFIRVNGVYTILDIDSNIFFISDGSYMGVEWSGWNPEVTYPIENNSASGSGFLGVTIGQENDKLTALFSTTPFIYEKGDINNKAIYRLKESSENLPVPVDGVTVVEKVYFNTSLSKEEVVEELQKLTLYELGGVTEKFAFLFICNDPQVGFFAQYNEENNLWEILDGSFELIFSSETGWEANFVSPMELNVVSVTDNFEIPVGQENDKITNLVSITPFGVSTKYTYWAYKDKWVQLIDSDNMPEVDSGITIINATSTGTNFTFEDVTLTLEQVKKAIEAKDCLLIVNIQGTIPFYFRKVDGYTFSDPSVESVTFVGHKVSLSSEGLYTASPNPILLYFSTNVLTAEVTYSSSGIEEFGYGTNSPSITLKSTEDGVTNHRTVMFDTTPTQNSNRLVSSGGVYTALQEKQNKITVTENDDGTVDITIPTE